MRVTLIATALAAVIPAFLGVAIAQDTHAFRNSIEGSSIVEPFTLEGRAVGGSIDRRGYPGMQAYNDASGSEHQSRWNSLSSSGWRLLSLSVSGEVQNPRYAAVWVKSGGGGMAAIHDASAQQYEDFFNTWAGKGYVATMLSVVGPEDSAVFAGVMEQANVGNWYAQYGLSEDAVTAENEKAQRTGYFPKTIAIYGRGGADARRYAVIYHENRSNKQWVVHTSDVDWNMEMASRVMQRAGWYSDYVSGDQDGTIAAIWVTPSALPPNYEFNGMDTLAEYQGTFNSGTSRGKYPYQVQVSGVGATTYYWSCWRT
ncbi:MAG: hypothetical protein M1833_004802 [Piccolia ochrophora]|nr:MAG: hypothetical protein M1833_004802 [Piccolia ochrophora]